MFTGAGAEVAPPTAGFYVYPDFSRVREALAGVRTGDELAWTLLEEHGIATLPGRAFGDDPDRLALRVATSMLYGEDDHQREEALGSDRPAELPWIAASLDTVRTALGELVGAR